jgi:DNA-binding NarL/FixJ family response regulator
VVSSSQERRFTVHSVLVCVRTLVAAQTIATCAARLGMATAVRTALTAAEALTHLAAEPAEVVLADTALFRSDSAEFTRRVLGVAPDAAVLLFGPEEPRHAAAAVSAGARGVIRADHGDAVTLVTKALLLVLGQPGAGHRHGCGEPDSAGHREARERGAPQPVRRAVAAPTGNGPVSSRIAAATLAAAMAQPRTEVRAEPPRRRVDLTERELQVLRGMADGKSNAEIGRELYVSEDTVKTHARRLFRKLGARDRAHAVASAFRAGLVS